MLSIVLKNAMDQQRLSSHKAAEAIGVSHTTILRALRGEAVDVETIIKIVERGLADKARDQKINP